MITEDYVSFETAKLLKEKGFDEELETVYSEYGELHRIFDKDLYESTNSFKSITNSHYNDITKYKYDFFVTAPTIQMAMKWLREVHNISVEPLVDFGSGDGYWWTADVGYIRKDGLIDELCGYNSYEEACEAAIKYCLENLI